MQKKGSLSSTILTWAIVAAAAAVFIFSVGAYFVNSSSHRLELTPAEWKWLAEHDGKITLGADPGYPPVDFINNQGMHDGYAEGFFRILEQRLSFHFKRVNPADWNDLLQKMKDKKIDVIKCAVKTPDRSEYLLFSQPYISVPTVIIVRDDNPRSLSLKDLNGKKVAVSNGYSIHEYLKRNYPRINLFPVKNDLAALESAASGESDAAVSDLPTAAYYMLNSI